MSISYVLTTLDCPGKGKINIRKKDVVNDNNRQDRTREVPKVDYRGRRGGGRIRGTYGV